MNDDDAIRQEHQRIRQELKSVRKFSPDWFRLKEEVDACNIQLQLDYDDNSEQHSPGVDNTLDDDLHNHDNDSSDGDVQEELLFGDGDPLDGRVARLIDNQLLQFGEDPSGVHQDGNSEQHHNAIASTHIPPSSQQVAQRLIGDQLKFSGSDDEEDELTHLGKVLHHNHSPLEISSSRQSFGDSSRRRSSSSASFFDTKLCTSPSRPDPPDKRVFFDISRKSNFRLGVCRNKFRQAKTILVYIVAVILVASAALIMMNTFKSNVDSSEAEDSMDNLHGQEINPSIDTEEIILGGDEPNPPTLPDSMILFHPPKNEQEIEQIRTTLKEYSDPIITWEEHSNNQPKPEGYPDFTYTTAKHFSSQRTALLFAPGKYPNLDFEVGYYTSVIGLGAHPTDVFFSICAKGPHVPAMEKFTNRPPHGYGLDTFWRSIENVATDARDGMQWTVSQAAPLRRMHIQTDLNLFDADSWVSGGVAANVVVDGKVNFGGQQQWLMRNVELKEGAANGAWSLVFVGCTGNVPEESDGMANGPSISVENNANVRVEKPYIVMKTDRRSMMHERQGRHANQVDQYQLELRVPAATFGKDTNGPQFEDEQKDIRDFRRVKLAVPSSSEDLKAAAIENRSALQHALDDGKDLVLSPGIYPLSQSLIVKYDNQVILGLGYATLVAPENGLPCISIHPGVPGVRIAGIMLEASAQMVTKHGKTTSLLEWGAPRGHDPGDESNPGVLSDIYARVGGLSREVSADVMIQLHSGNIYGDNVWLWRADHVQLRPNEEPNFPRISLKYRQTQQGECEVKNGLVIDTDATNVTIVGLAVEHTTEDQVIWKGDNGQVYFYQCELPYDADHSFADKKFVGYKVGPKAENHKAVGLGVYSNFRDHDIEVWTGVVHPPNDGIQMKNILTVKLDNEGKISSVVNGRGPGPTVGTERGHPYRCSDETCGDEKYEEGTEEDEEEADLAKWCDTCQYQQSDFTCKERVQYEMSEYGITEDKAKKANIEHCTAPIGSDKKDEKDEPDDISQNEEKLVPGTHLRRG